MKQHANFLTFATPDLDAARAFYRDGLGWTPSLDVPGEILFFQIAPGLVLALFDAVKFEADLDGTAPAGPISGVTIAHNVDGRDEVSSVVDQMKAAGATALKGPKDAGFGNIFHALVRDPNGVIWEIAHNPALRISADGAVSLG